MLKEIQLVVGVELVMVVEKQVKRRFNSSPIWREMDWQNIDPGK